MATINAVGNGLSGSTGSGTFVGATSPTLVTPALGTPSALVLTNATGLPVASLVGQVSLANGGTAANLTASNGGIFYSTATAGAILSGTATAGQMLQSGSSAAPAWSTATFPATTSINQLLYSSSNNVVGGITAGANGVLVSNASNVPSWLANGTAGYVLTAQSGAAPAWAVVPAAATSLTGDTGSATGASVQITALDGANNAGASVNFAASGSKVVLNITDASGNIYLGLGVGSAPSAGASNLALGTGGNLTFLTAGDGNISIGTNGLRNLTTGDYNEASGVSSLITLTTGSYNLASGFLSGNTYSGGESSNILFNSPGVNSESNTLRIGSSTGSGDQSLNRAFISGIRGITAATADQLLVVNSSDQIVSIGAGSAGQLLQSGGAGANPAFTTSTYPATNAVNTLLYASSANTMAALATDNSSVLVTNSSGAPAWSGALTNGQVIVGSTGATPVAATLTAGVGISITNAAGSITISSPDSGVAWAGIAGTSQAAAVNSGYIVQNASATTITLPATAAIGDSVSVRGLGAAGFVLAANTGQTIKYINATTTSGGSLTSAGQYDSIDVTCVVADTTWIVSAAASTGFTVA